MRVIVSNIGSILKDTSLQAKGTKSTSFRMYVCKEQSGLTKM